MFAVIRVPASISTCPVGLGGCGEQPQPLLMFSGDNSPEKLSQRQLYHLKDSRLQLAEGVVPFKLPPLFTDYASKLQPLP
ncbi:MAG: hypothetical protein ACPG5T_10595 [Endozoicomonas sp.]